MCRNTPRQDLLAAVTSPRSLFSVLFFLGWVEVSRDSGFKSVLLVETVKMAGVCDVGCYRTLLVAWYWGNYFYLVGAVLLTTANTPVVSVRLAYKK